MRFKDRDADSEAGITLTPLIDVVFLLLIFFMVTTTFSKEAQIKLRLPESESAEKIESKENLLIIRIDAAGQYAVKGANDAKPRRLVNVKSDTLRRAVARAAQGMNDPVVLIRADHLTTHESVVKAMTAAQRAGLNQITFAANKESE